MRIVRYEHAGRTGYGRLEGDSVRPVAGMPWESMMADGQAAPLESIKLLAPVEPSQIIAIGRNYKDHAAEFNNEVPERPMTFSKTISSIIGPNEAIEIPPDVGRVDHEAELAVVIGRKCRRVGQAEALDYVLGYTCLNDVSSRLLQQEDTQFTRGKGFDTFCPIGPWIVTDLDASDLAIRADVNGRLAQDDRTSLMIFTIPFIISFISRFMTLKPGDVIATGTPAGVGPLSPGDTVTIEIEGIGRLTNPVVAAEPFNPVS